MGNNPASGVDPNGAWVKGAGLLNNLFKSDARIHSEQIAESWNSGVLAQATNTTYWASKEGGVWGVYGVQSPNYAERTQAITYTPIDGDGNFGITESYLSSWQPIEAIEFDPIGQLTFTPTGSAVVGIPLRAGMEFLGSVVVRSTTAVISRTTSSILNFTARQLQTKFKHAADFGVAGNYSRANAANFSAAINQHINALGTEVIHGTYRNAS